jgi:hypothetical protein
MNDLIFLPIEIDIKNTSFSVNKKSYSTFEGLWETKDLTDEEILSTDINTITDQLPYEKITFAKYNTQLNSIPAHVDVKPIWTKTVEEYQHIKKNEPAGYRVVLIGDKDSLEIFNGESWKKARLPSVPFAYVINSTNYKHRVLEDKNRQTLYFRGFLNRKKHLDIIEKNLQKYQEYTIYKIK